VNVPFEEGDSLEMIAEKLAKICRDSIAETNRVMRYPLMENVVRCLLKSRSIDIYAEGDSLLGTFEFRSKMQRIRKNVRIEQGFVEKQFMAVNSDKDNCAIIISHSGANENMLRVAKILKKKRTPILIITSDPDAAISREASYIIQTGTAEKKDSNSKLSFYGSQYAVHYILDCLFSFIYSKDYYENMCRSADNENLIQTIKRT